jgi:hypothetical protein
MNKIHELRSQGHIKPLPFTTYHVSKIDRALATFSKGTHIGKLILSYEDQPGMGIKVRAGNILLELLTDFSSFGKVHSRPRSIRKPHIFWSDVLEGLVDLSVTGPFSAVRES